MHLFSIKKRLKFFESARNVSVSQRDCFVEWIKNAKLPQRATVLSLSVGDGVWDYFAMSSDNRIKKIIATDIVENPVKKEDIALLKKYGEWDYIKVTPEGKLPFKNSFFNLLFHQDTIEHVEKPFIFISEQYRVLKKDGILVFGTPNLFRLTNIVKLFFGRLNFPTAIGRNIELGTFVHVQEFYEQQIKVLLKEAGFRNIEVRHCFFGVNTLKIMFSKYPRSNLGKGLCHYLMFKCVK